DEVDRVKGPRLRVAFDEGGEKVTHGVPAATCKHVRVIPSGAAGNTQQKGGPDEGGGPSKQIASRSRFEQGSLLQGAPASGARHDRAGRQQTAINPPDATGIGVAGARSGERRTGRERGLYRQRSADPSPFRERIHGDGPTDRLARVTSPARTTLARRPGDVHPDRLHNTSRCECPPDVGGRG